MRKYTIDYFAYKQSGKFYNSGSHLIGEFDKYPADEIFKKMNDLAKDLDKACQLLPGTIEANNFTVICMVLDNTEAPVNYTVIVRNKK